MPKTVHITSAHPHFDTRIFHKECKTLAENGYEVVLIVPHEFDEMLNGVQIRAIPKSVDRWKRMAATVGHVYRIALAEDADIYHLHDPELIPVGIWLKLKGRLVVYDAHEDLPRQILIKRWIPLRLRKLIGTLCELIELVSVKLFDGIVAATPRIAKRFPASKTISVQNFPMVNELLVETAKLYCNRRPLVAFVGYISEIRGPREMVQAMSLLPVGLDARLVLAGTFRPRELKSDVERLPGWERVDFLGWQDRREVASLLHEVRAGLVVLHPAPNYLDAYPVKLFEYMCVGLPIIASDFPLWREIIYNTQCGLVVDPLNPREIAEAIQWILEHPEEAKRMGERGRKAVLEHYNWDREAEKLLKIYDGLLGPGTQRSHTLSGL
jgi:glycosyltransferase involved in cell wall biosynthesis